MSRAMILQQVPYLSPGRLVPILRDYGIPTEVRHLYRGDEVPSDLDEIRLLIVLSGPASATDFATTPALQKQVDLITRMVHLDRTVVGINLGAQLLALAAGAKVHLNERPGAKPEDPKTPAPEFGWGGVNFPFPGGTEPLVMGMMDNAPMFHWHESTFELPRLPAPPNAPPPPAPPPPTGNALMASSKICRAQAFRFKTRLFGFQFHFELEERDIAALLEHEADRLTRAAGADAFEKIKTQTTQNYPRYARLGERLVRNFVQFLKAY